MLPDEPIAGGQLQAYGALGSRATSPVGGSSAVGKRSVNTTPSVLLEPERQSTRHLRIRPRGVMRNMNSSGTVSSLTSVIFAPIFEKLLRMQRRSQLPSASQIVAGEFHSTRKFFRRSRAIDVTPVAHSSPYERDSK